MQRRTWIPMVVSLLGGALLTTGIAWGAALFPEKGVVSESGAGGILDPNFPNSGWFVWVVEGRASTRLVAQASNYPLEPIPLPWWTSLPELCRAESAASSRVLSVRETWEVVEDASGWPCRALCAHCQAIVGPSMTTAHLQCFGSLPGLTKGGFGSMGGDPRTALQRLPTEVIWPGFALDTSIWGAAIWCVAWGPGTLRRWHRRRAGKCLSCGYLIPPPDSPLCPECGAAQ